MSRVTGRSEKILFDDVILLAARPMLPVRVAQAFRPEVCSRRGVVAVRATPPPPLFLTGVASKGGSSCLFSIKFRDKREQLVASLAHVDDFRPGFLTARFRKCGKPNCHCAQKGAPGHGPSFSNYKC